ncbi:hypothetical protein S40288_00553 [Stachybotrys chartarum IBT 40288]|nr:hypothetical protein S40288_00553 [Stachybotrys chartarum IBT 40288]
MRLLQLLADGTLRLTEDLVSDIPPYAILSHTWGDNSQEVTLKDITEGRGTQKAGYRKITFCGEQAARQGLSYFWVDTCCIDKSSSAELSEAIISMYRWYKNSVKCYVYLSDVYLRSEAPDDLHPRASWKLAFRKSRWFARGWTLQELLAPLHVDFFSCEGEYLGNKASLESLIHDVTRIPISALRGNPLGEFSDLERLSWAESRHTKREEDKAYCLLGIFDVQIAPLYGEGGMRSMSRLRSEIHKRSNGYSLSAPATQTQNDRQEQAISNNRKPTTAERQNLVQSLKFDQIYARLSDLRPPKQQTCTWIMESKEYRHWSNDRSQKQHSGFLWIKGKPGAGKSILMKYLLTTSKTILPHTKTISFFFNARGAVLERSTKGLYRSLLFQLLSDPGLQTSLDEIFLQLDETVQLNDWKLEVLKDAFARVVAKLKQPIVCYVDALDECPEEEVRDMVYFFEEISSQAVGHQGRLRICLSSRHYPHITITRGLSLVLEQQSQHTSDIVRYVDSELRIGNSTNAVDIRKRVVAKASGVFLWVALVVPLLNKTFDRGNVQAMNRHLETLPTELSTLFQDLIFHDTEDREELLRCLQCVLFAETPLRLDQLYSAVQACTEPSRGCYLDRSCVNRDIMHRKILDISRGVIEETRGTKRTMQFIHESVRDFLLNKEALKQLWSFPPHDFIAESHGWLARHCLSQLMTNMADKAFIHAFATEPYSRVKQLREIFPFLEYAILNVLHHSNAAQALGSSQVAFLTEFPLQRWLKLYNAFEWNNRRHFLPDTGLLYLLAHFNLVDLVRIHPDRNRHHRTFGGRYGLPWLAAATQNSKAVLEYLSIQIYSDNEISIPMSRVEKETLYHARMPKRIDRRLAEPSTNPKSLIFYLAILGLSSIIQAILLSDPHEHPDARDEWGRTPLSYAAENGRVDTVRQLLNLKGVDSCSMDNSGRTPLLHAISHEREDIVVLFLGETWSSSKDQTMVKSKRDIRAKPLFVRVLNVLKALNEDGIKKCLEMCALTMHTKDRFGRTIPSYAAEFGMMHIVQEYIKPEDVDSGHKDVCDDKTPLMYAAEKGQKAVVEFFLLSDRADPDQKNKYGWTPLMYAAEKGHKAVVELLLLSSRVDPDQKDINAMTPLMFAAEKGHKAVVELLLLSGRVDPNQKDVFGRTPLLLAVRSGFEEIAEVIHDSGRANPHLADISGHTPELYARERGEKDLVERCSKCKRPT